MKKIGILTYHWVSNFGAQLQTLSTYKCIENSGNYPIIINWIPEDLKKYYEKYVSKEQNEAHAQYAEKYYKNITKVCRNKFDIAQVIDDENIDVVIIGSDAVFSYTPFWSRFVLCRKGLRYIKPLSDFDCPNPFWGDFYDLVKRPIKLVSMSASAQNTPYRKIVSKKEKSKFESAINNFSYISVRDVWTQKMLSHVTKGKCIPSITPDPVFAFEYNVAPSNDDYIKNVLGVTGEYALLSLSGKYSNPDWERELEKLFAQQGITLIGLPQTNKKFNRSLKYNLSFPLDPIQWYNIIKHSSAYIGELMHPILVSLHNSVPIFVFDNYGFKSKGDFDKTSSKTYQIISRFSFESNYYNKLYNRLFPTPQDVIGCVLSFDKNKCKGMAEVMYENYKKMIDEILNV